MAQLAINSASLAYGDHIRLEMLPFCFEISVHLESFDG